MTRRSSVSPLLLAALAVCAGLPAALAQTPPPAPDLPHADAASIVAVVNGDVISREDVDDRRRLFALSAGLPESQDVLDRLTPQITQQLIDERLRLQEMQRRRIVVSDQDIARAIGEVESRNGMPPGTLQRRLDAAGVGLRTLIDQIRVQIGWTRVLRQVLGPQAQVSDADVADQLAAMKSEIGKPEFEVGEIFIPVDNPQSSAQAQKFADVVIQQLHDGAPFSVAAAQFSQSQTALAGGDLGWVQPENLDPAVADILGQMPVGAVSNPIRVPGGIDIVTLRGKREVGRDVQDVLDMRQAFIPFTTRLDPQAPTEQQKQALGQAQKLSASANSCDAIEAADKQFASGRPSNPGPVVLSGVPPAMKAVLQNLQPGHASQPLVAEDGIAVVMVCGRETKTEGLPSKAAMTERILSERVERASRQLQLALQRRAVIEQRA
jgi:peptidyl-prolyl cis-trans isomerase SurA